MRFMMATMLLLAPAAVRAQDSGFTPGRYHAVPRDSTALNRFRSVEFDFRPDGLLLWRQLGEVVQMMAWRSVDGVFEIDEAVGCSTAPRGAYQIARWMNGFAFEVLQDGCTGRVAALNTIYLVRQDSLASTAGLSRSPDPAAPASPASSPVPRSD